MLRFKSFIAEANLANSGSEAERHAKKYITPHIGSAEPTHTISSDTNNLRAGERVYVHGHEVDEQGKHHAIVSKTGSERDTVKVPFSKLSKPKTSYSDEHAITHLWNHSVKHGIHNSIEDMHTEIEKAKSDPSHPLSFENADSRGFTSRDKQAKGAREAYFNELKAATHTVHAIARSKEAKKKIENGDHQMSVSGGERGTVQNAYTKYGMKQGGASATSKTDLKIGNQQPIRLSVKKAKGSQLASSESADFQGIVHSAAHALHRDGHITQGQRDQMIQHAAKIAEIQKKGPAAAEHEHEGNVREGQAHLEKLLSIHPKSIEYMRKEAATGEGKYGSGSEATPTHIVKHGPGASVTSVDEYDHGGKAPRFAKSKGRGREYTVRFDT